MAHKALNRSVEGRCATRAARVSRSSLRCQALNITHQAQGPPPAWDKRVVVPEVEPRSTPKVCWGVEIPLALLAEQLSTPADGQLCCHQHNTRTLGVQQHQSILLGSTSSTGLVLSQLWGVHFISQQSNVQQQ
jgi:hypothetical protein